MFEEKYQSYVLFPHLKIAGLQGLSLGIDFACLMGTCNVQLLHLDQPTVRLI